MTSFTQPAPGTDSPVPVAGSQPNPAQVAALQSMWVAMNSLAQAQVAAAPQPPVASAPPAVTLPAAPMTPAPMPATPTPASQVPAAPPPTASTGFRTRGPWVVGALYHVVPSGPLMPIAEDDTSERMWHCISRGLYVGITLSNPLALTTVVSISGSSMKGHKTQAKAVAAFNEMLAFNMISVLQ
ncbi:hypothetical protein B0H13DRAFT_1933426 [Mycena leptocephala]|nr:hypothetical protein B0H13DRAFT_1933426 [Mycena leptocephala]